MRKSVRLEVDPVQLRYRSTALIIISGQEQAMTGLPPSRRADATTIASVVLDSAAFRILPQPKSATHFLAAMRRRKLGGAWFSQSRCPLFLVDRAIRCNPNKQSGAPSRQFVQASSPIAPLNVHTVHGLL